MGEMPTTMLKMGLLLLLALVSPGGAPQPVPGTKWAVIIAGSNEYYNYRHQADISHAYQVLHKLGGFPPENIVTMMYDDIAHNQQNPIQGNIINHPNGTNVYTGVTIDYKGNDVNAQMFLDVLEGTAPKKSLKGMTKNDDLFVYFSDHGAQGLVAMPTGDPLYADALHKTLKKMYQNKAYKQMVVYIEACESGSMFDGLLPADWNIYATTASDGEHSSYACYWDDLRQVYLGDVYSVNFLEDTEQYEMNGETLEEQWKHVAKKTNTSTVMQFGDMDMTKELDSEFLTFKGQFIRHMSTLKGAPSDDYTGPSVSSRDVLLSSMQMRLRNEIKLHGDSDLAEHLRHKISAEIANRQKWDLYFDTMAKNILDSHEVPLSQRQSELDWIVRGRVAPTNFDCLRRAYKSTEDCMGRFTDYSLQFVRTMVNLCETVTMAEMTDLLDTTCRNVQIVNALKDSHSFQ